MRRTASEVLRDLEIRIARLERQSALSDQRIADIIRLNHLDRLERGGYVIADEYDSAPNVIKKHPTRIKRFDKYGENPNFIPELVKDIKKTLGFVNAETKKTRGVDGYDKLHIIQPFYTDASESNYEIHLYIDTFFPTLTLLVRPV